MKFFKSVAQWAVFCMLIIVLIPAGIVLGVMQETEDRKKKHQQDKETADEFYERQY